MRKILMRLCDFLEKKLYSEPTYQEMMKVLDRTKYKLSQAKAEIIYLEDLVKLIKNKN